MHGAARKSVSAMPMPTSMGWPVSATAPSHFVQSVPKRSKGSSKSKT